MAPAVTIDNTPDFEMASAPTTITNAAPRTLLLAPPTVAAHPELLSQVTAAYDRTATDIQMLDRLALGLVSLPAETYDMVLLLTDVDNTNAPRLDRAVTERIVASMKAGGKLQSQDGAFASTASPEQTEAILAGLVRSDAGEAMVKPNPSAGQTVSLRLGAGKKKADAAAVPANGLEAVGIAKRKSEAISTGGSAQANGNGNGSGSLRSTPAGVGFIDTNDDLDDGYESDDMEIPSNEELERADRIDPDTLLTEEDRQRPLVIPEACKPNTKRRRACKDCTCGLAQRLEAEDRAKRATADANLVKLSATDLADAEVDFTVQGKVGSCGNCALGDAFRCDGCPYIGLPAFKPGEEVRLLNNEVQL